jgi:hypothetical protein
MANRFDILSDRVPEEPELSDSDNNSNKNEPALFLTTPEGRNLVVTHYNMVLKQKPDGVFELNLQLTPEQATEILTDFKNIYMINEFSPPILTTVAPLPDIMSTIPQPEDLRPAFQTIFRAMTPPFSMGSRMTHE